MRRTILSLAVVLSVVGFIALPAAASTPWHAESPVYQLDCTAYGDGGVYFAQPVRAGTVGWDYYGTDLRPLAQLMYSADIAEDPVAVHAASKWLTKHSDRFTICEIYGPVMETGPGVWAFDPSWDFEVNIWGWFRFF